MLVAAGLADFALMAFHFERADTMLAAFVRVLCAAAMGAGGLGALVFGWLLDRYGLRGVIIPATLATALFAPLSFLRAAAIRSPAGIGQASAPRPALRSDGDRQSRCAPFADAVLEASGAIAVLSQ